MASRLLPLFAAIMAAPVLCLDASIITTATFPGGAITTPVAGSYSTTASLPVDAATWGSLYDPVSGTVGGGSVSGSLYYSWTGRSNATDYTSPPRVNGTDDYAVIQIFDGGTGKLGVGNYWGAWAYSTLEPNADLRRPSDNTYLQVQSGVDHLFVVKMDFVANGNDTATIWMDPVPAHGDTQAATVYTVTHTRDYSFDEVRARTGSNNDNNSWTFTDVTFGEDWSTVPVPEPSTTLVLTPLALTLLLFRRRRGGVL